MKLAEAAVYNLYNRSSKNRGADSCGGYDLKVFFNGAWRRVSGSFLKAFN